MRLFGGNVRGFNNLQLGNLNRLNDSTHFWRRNFKFCFQVGTYNYSVTRCWNKWWPKFAESGPKRCQSIFFFKRDVFRVFQQFTKTLGYFCRELFCWQNRPIWSLCLRTCFVPWSRLLRWPKLNVNYLLESSKANRFGSSINYFWRARL